MKLPDPIRKQLRAGQAVQHTFTQPVKREGIYVIHNQNGTNQGHFRVIQVARDEGKWKALITYEADPVRIPSKDGAYTDFAGRAMPRGDEPGPELEAVDEETQREMSKLANERFDEYVEKTRPDEVREREQRILANKIHRVQKGFMKRGIDIAPQMIAYLESLEVRGDEQREAA